MPSAQTRPRLTSSPPSQNATAKDSSKLVTFVVEAPNPLPEALVDFWFVVTAWNCCAPDDVAADPHPPPQLADRRALLGVGDGDRVELGRAVAPRGERIGEEVVDHSATDRAQRPADEATHGPAERRAQRRARDERRTSVAMGGSGV